MPSRDWDDSWYDDDEFPPLRKNRGRGAVVTVAVITFIMCGFNALCASCLLLCGFIFAAVGQNNGDFLPGNLMQHAALIMLGIGISSAVVFVLQIIAGIGLINSRRWLRTLSFYLGGYSLLIVGLLVYLIISTLTSNAGNPDDIAGSAAIYISGLVFHGGYAATVFLVLLNGRVAASFR